MRGNEHEPANASISSTRRCATASRRRASTFRSRTRSPSPKLLDEFGIDYVEGGYPGANPTDTAFFAEKRTANAKFVAFGMTKRAGVSASNDPGLAALVQSKSDAICFVAKSWDYHVRVALGCTNEENLDAISASVEAAIAAGKEAMVDCEHFFDGFKANPDYALACAKTAYDAGARWVVLCDTNGGTQPSEVRDIVEKVIASGIPGETSRHPRA